MKERVKLNVSAHHVHLTKSAIEQLFNHDLTVRNKLNQPSFFASNETVNIKTDKGEIKNVRVIGPARDYNQVEVTKSDARILGLNPPVRKSGDLTNAEKVIIYTDKGEVVGNYAIIIDRHVHMSESDAKRLNVQDDDILKLVVGGSKPGIMLVNAKVTEDGYFEVHLDTDDANAFLITPGDIGILRK